jgi:DNA repair exonuclease SbcCD ATPase subunit
MTRLSSPESAIRKIAAVEERIETLYAAVDRIQELRDRLSATADAAGEHETALRERLETLGTLESEYRTAVARLSELGDRTAREMAAVQAALEWERDGVRNTRADFQTELARQEKLRAALFAEISAAAKETAEGTAWLQDRVDRGLQDLDRAMARERDEIRAAAARERAAMADAAELIREEAFHLEDRLERFKADLSGRFDRRVDLLAERQRNFRETAIQELHQRFTETAESLQGRADAVEAELREAGAAEQTRVSEAVAFLETERSAAAARAETAAAEEARRRADADALIESTRERTDQTLGDLNAVMRREVEHVAAFIADAESQIQGLKGELKGFRDRVTEAVNRRAETLRNEQSAFQDALRAELEGRVSESLNTARRAVDQRMEALASERKSVEEMHQALDEALSQVNRRIQERTSFFSTQLNNLILESQKELSGAAESARSRMEKQARKLGAFADEQRTGLKKLRDQVRGFADTVRERLDADRKRQEAAWAEFRKEIGERVDARIGREAARQAETLRAELEKRLAEADEERRADAEAVNGRATAVEGRMSDLESSQSEAESALRQRMSAVKKAVKRLVERQERADRTLPDLEARLAAVEEALQSRKGLFSFPGRKRESEE